MIDPNKHDIIFEMVEFAHMNYSAFIAFINERGIDIDVEVAISKLEEDLHK